jgi:hypothetical protein
MTQKIHFCFSGLITFFVGDGTGLADTVGAKLMLISDICTKLKSVGAERFAEIEDGFICAGEHPSFSRFLKKSSSESSSSLADIAVVFFRSFYFNAARKKQNTQNHDASKKKMQTPPSSYNGSQPINFVNVRISLFFL